MHNPTFVQSKLGRLTLSLSSRRLHKPEQFQVGYPCLARDVVFHQIFIQILKQIWSISVSYKVLWLK